MALDPDDDRAPYLQVAEALRNDIEAQLYPPGTRLPSRKELAARFDVAPMTVQSAIRELRTAGLIVSRQGAGVFVRTRHDEPAQEPDIARRRRSMSFTFDGLTDEQYDQFANGAWGFFNTLAHLAGTSFTATHDGDHDLSRCLDGAWVRDTGTTTWTHHDTPAKPQDSPAAEVRRRRAAGRPSSTWTVDFAEEVLSSAQPAASKLIRALVDEGGKATATRLKELTGENALHHMTQSLNTAARRLWIGPTPDGQPRLLIAQPRRDPDHPRVDKVHSYELSKDHVAMWDEALKRLGR